MRLDQMTWREVECFLEQEQGVLLLPVGSTEQHGPMGLIGTDAFCAAAIAERAAQLCDATIIAPTIAFTPAPFNMAFPGTISMSEGLFCAMVGEIVDGLAGQGFRYLYFLNAHGANLAPLRSVAADRPGVRIRIRSWWEFSPVNRLRQEWYGDWEGMHATPSEIAITMTSHRIPPVPAEALVPPNKLPPDYARLHAGDRHGPPDQHRREFPDGRVGSHSALANARQGATLLGIAAACVAEDIVCFTGRGQPHP